MAPDGRGRALAVQAHRAAQEEVRIEIAKDQVRVGDGWPIAAQPVARRTRIGGGAVRPHAQQAELVNARDRSAAGADLDHLDHRHLQRQAAALGEAVHARHLELVGAFGLASVDDADLGGRAARRRTRSRPARRRAGPGTKRRALRPRAPIRPGAPDSAAPPRARWCRHPTRSASGPRRSRLRAIRRPADRDRSGPPAARRRWQPRCWPARTRASRASRPRTARPRAPAPCARKAAASWRS